jgi:hypothetical protein
MAATTTMKQLTIDADSRCVRQDRRRAAAGPGIARRSATSAGFAESIGTDAATVEARAIEVCGPAAGEQPSLVVPPRLG